MRIHVSGVTLCQNYVFYQQVQEQIVLCQKEMTDIINEREQIRRNIQHVDLDG